MPAKTQGQARRTNARLFLSACLQWAAFVSVASADPLELGLPVDCEVGRSCAIQNYVDRDPLLGARDYACGTLTYDGHNGTDFRVPSMAAQRAGVDVLAAADGEVLRTRDGMPDVSMAAPPAPSVADRECGNGIVLSHRDGWQTQYCHLAKDSVRVKSGERVAAGQPIGRVGLSGRTEFPHLHFTVRHHGRVVDPFAYGAPEGTCQEGTWLWSPAVRKSLAYRARMVLNAGFAPGPITNETIESGDADLSQHWAEAPALVAFVRTIGLKAGDTQRLAIRAPDGQTIADHSEKPIDPTTGIRLQGASIFSSEILVARRHVVLRGLGWRWGARRSRIGVRRRRLRVVGIDLWVWVRHLKDLKRTLCPVTPCLVPRFRSS
jgi:murein DD-endopeptidase MepM/ murein hydrolase activator NlpD